MSSSLHVRELPQVACALHAVVVATVQRRVLQEAEVAVVLALHVAVQARAAAQNHQVPQIRWPLMRTRVLRVLVLEAVRGAAAGWRTNCGPGARR